MDQRRDFVLEAMNCSNFRALCREYEISAKTGYKWLERFKRRGLEGLSEKSRRPHSHAHRLEEAVVCEIIRLKSAHPRWGPRKIRELYRRLHEGAAPADVPSESSFKRVLERAGMTEPRKRRRAAGDGARRLGSGRVAGSPNEVWTVDFKGWWKDRDGLKVEPLTVRDEYSRMLLDIRVLANSRTESVRACFEKLFEEHGLPGAVRSDNGPPFASSRSLLGLSRLSAWWLALGIDLERGRPGCPQDNGAHERMHRDVRDDLQAAGVGGEQQAYDMWREEFNTVRPHEALGMATPADVYHPSERRYQGTPDELDYGSAETRRVNPRNGTIRYAGLPVYLSRAIGGWDVALVPKPETGRIRIRFASLLLGELDPETVGFKPADPTKEGGATGVLAGSATAPPAKTPGLASQVDSPNLKPTECNP